MINDEIDYLRRKAAKLREVALGLDSELAGKLVELADEFELKADEFEAARRARTVC